MSEVKRYEETPSALNYTEDDIRKLMCSEVELWPVCEDYLYLYAKLSGADAQLARVRAAIAKERTYGARNRKACLDRIERAMNGPAQEGGE